MRECKVGDTFAIMYANSHAFMDGKVGIRVEADEFVQVGVSPGIPCDCDEILDFQLFHCDLKSVLEIGKILSSSQSACRGCGKPATSQCAKCTMKYCTKVFPSVLFRPIYCILKYYNEGMSSCGLETETQTRVCCWTARHTMEGL